MLLRAAWIAVAVGWGLGACALAMGDAALWAWLDRLGGSPVPYHPAVAYWVRMAACCCAFIAAVALWNAWRPQPAMAWFAAAFHAASALALWGWGAALGLGFAVWGIDVVFCAGCAVALAAGLLVARRAG